MSLVHNSKQIFLYSRYASIINTNRNRCTFQMAEPIHAPDGYKIHCIVVESQIPITASMGTRLFFLVGSSFNDYNACSYNNTGAVGGRFLAKIPNNAVTNFICTYNNFTNFSSVLADNTIHQIELQLFAEDGSDINMGAGNDWAITLQFDIVKIKS